MQETRERVGAPAALRLRPLEGGLGAEILGLAVAAIDDATFPAIHAAFLAHQLLLFRDQALDVGQRRRFLSLVFHDEPSCKPWCRMRRAIR